jgi:hypothetical protein
MLSKFTSPGSNSFIADLNATISQLFRHISQAMIEGMIHPNSLANDRYRKTMTLRIKVQAVPSYNGF